MISGVACHAYLDPTKQARSQVFMGQSHVYMTSTYIPTTVTQSCDHSQREAGKWSSQEEEATVIC